MTWFQETYLIFMNHVYISFVWQMFVKNAVLIRAQQTNENISKILLEQKSQKNRFVNNFTSLPIPSPKAIKTFILFRKNIFLAFIAIYTFKSAVYKIKGVEELKMPNISYTNQKRVEFVM